MSSFQGDEDSVDDMIDLLAAERSQVVVEKIARQSLDLAVIDSLL